MFFYFFNLMYGAKCFLQLTSGTWWLLADDRIMAVNRL